MSVIRTVFLGTPDFASACLQALLDDEHFQIVGVVSQPDRRSGRKMRLTPSPVKQLALDHDISVITPESINEKEALEYVKSWGAEAAVVVAYGQIVSQKFLDLYPKQVVNVHASILPRWRGAAPIQRAIMAGDNETGVSLQVMVKKLDAGDVLGSRKMAITDEMTAIDLHEKMKPLAADLLRVEFMDYLRGNLAPQPQDPSQVTYAHKLEKSEGVIDWSRSAREIFNRIRGLALGPGAFTLRDGKKLKVHKAQVKDVSSSALPGTVMQVDERSFVVACGEQALQIEEIQPESRARQQVADYLKGYSLKAGDKLGE